MVSHFFSAGLAAIGLLSLADAAHAAALDPLLDGFERNCSYTEPLHALFQSSYLVARKEGPLVVPQGYEAAFGAPVTTQDGEYLRTVIPVVAGTWRGVPVREFEIYITELASDFVYHAVIFDRAAEDEAKAAFDRPLPPSGAPSDTEDGASGPMSGFGIFDGVPRYFCDLSG
ncbi:hypothetical protein LXM94_16080 [Rhizobium sp. TRM95111]|uniref:hypothetical protein n=1 Tax=Rhizobium alarense TaxID=2846851 RepID=UPI001F190BE8|nr:hypothetical protein [Rhizobium alarense]MCF3641492.1 hypothetical protein [Rhizobium alarense]